MQVAFITMNYMPRRVCKTQGILSVHTMHPHYFYGVDAMAETQEKKALEKKSLGQPDEVRPFKDGKGQLAVFTLGGRTLGRGEFEPGWRWSEHVKPIAGTDSCQATHTGVVLEGRMVVKMIDGGAEMEFGPGDVFFMPPGHDAWVVGNQRCVLFDVTGVAQYAKPH
jgi:quercetin dioxygenase-like cupin family protein